MKGDMPSNVSGPAYVKPPITNALRANGIPFAFRHPSHAMVNTKVLCSLRNAAHYRLLPDLHCGDY